MATFLVTPQMNPALRARVERAVSHKKRAKQHAAKLGLAGTLGNQERLRAARVLPVVLVLFVTLLGTGTYLYTKRELEKGRAALLSTMTDRRAEMPAGHERFLGAVDHLITETAGDPVPPDVIDTSPMRAAGALDAWLKRPAVYLHGTVEELRDSQKLDDAAAASDKDPFLGCLITPPASDSEKDLLAKVKGVYFAGAKVDEATANVHRLTEARLGLAVLGPAFEEKVRTGTDLNALHHLRKELEAAPLDRAKKAVAAELLIVVADTAAPTGSREARVALIDLTTKTVLLRARARIAQQGRTAASAFYTNEIDACALALAVRRSVTP